MNEKKKIRNKLTLSEGMLREPMIASSFFFCSSLFSINIFLFYRNLLSLSPLAIYIYIYLCVYALYTVHVCKNNKFKKIRERMVMVEEGREAVKGSILYGMDTYVYMSSCQILHRAPTILSALGVLMWQKINEKNQQHPGTNIISKYIIPTPLALHAQYYYIGKREREREKELFAPKRYTHFFFIFFMIMTNTQNFFCLLQDFSFLSSFV